VTKNEATAEHAGVLQSTFDVFIASTRAVTDVVTAAGAAGARAVLPAPVNDSVNHMLVSLRDMAEQAPQITDEIVVLTEELHAKRLSIQAVQSELTVLDHQLDLLERSLAPVQAWSEQWNRMQHALLHTLDLPTETDNPGAASA
jgi:hypothetical protein